MSTDTKTRKRMGITTIISSLIIVSSLVWAIYGYGIGVFVGVREYEPHFPYDDVEYWPYNNNFTGGTTDWNEGVNYTDILLEQPLPNGTLDNLDEIVFVVTPRDPGQLWRTGSYDAYDGDTNIWSKSDVTPVSLLTEQLIPLVAAPNTPYSIFFYATAGATVGAIELPIIFPDIRFIEDSFQTYSLVDDVPVLDVPSRIESYTLETDAYGSLLFTPFILGATGEKVLVSYDISYENQDLSNVIANARNGSFPGYTAPYRSNSFIPTARVSDNYTQFIGVGNNVYERAMVVQVYFQSTFDLIIDLADRPSGQETTDWFLERGGGLPMDFATAYCTFMRGLNIPARMVKGYALGEPDPLNDLRSVQVRHMLFWAEVFVPMAGGDGEWIQVIPTPLPPGFGGGAGSSGGEIPGNTPIPNIELLIWPTSGQPWAQVGDPFNLSTSLTVEGIPVTTPEDLIIYDELDSVDMGTHTLGDQINYTFPSGATIDYHIISAQWQTSTLSVINATSIFAVGTPSPMSEPEFTGEFVLSEMRDLNVSQGVDTHITYWEDTIHVYGTMTVGGVPVNSSNYGNKWIQIMWDNTVMGDAFINDYGYYELNIYVDPLNLVDMTVGIHEVWSWYAGDWDGPIPRLNEARSSDNSTATVWGRVGFTLDVSPTAAFRGADVYYDGMIQFLNGSLLPSGQNVGVFFGSQANASRPLNVTGGFTWMYTIPLGQAEGTYWARANWSSPWQYIAGNWSISIRVDVESGGSQLSINQLPDPLYIGRTVTINGTLTNVSSSSGIGGQWVDVWWYNGITVDYLGSALTAVDGFYELNHTILSVYTGPIEYWSNFTSGIPTLASSESPHLFTTVKTFDVTITISVLPDPVYLLQNVKIEGLAYLPEAGNFPLGNEQLTIWLQNSTGIYNLTATWTNITGGYLYYYPIPLNQAIETVWFWATYTSPYINVGDGESFHEPTSIEATDMLISIQEDFTQYYLNDTIFLYGNLRFQNGTPYQNQKVYIHWVNASGTFVFEKFTDAFGNYSLYYNLTTNDAPGFIDVYVNWTSPTAEFDDAFSTLAPPIELRLYSLEITLDVPTQIYVDELLDVEGVLSYIGGFPPISGEWIDFYYWDGGGWSYISSQLTNSSGGFLFPPYDLGAPTEETIRFCANYTSTDPLADDAFTLFDVTRVKYAVNLEVTLNFNPIMQNRTLTIHAYLSYAHNGTPISGADVLIYWDNGTIPFYLGTITTDGTGNGDLLYSGMKYDDVRTGIHVYGDYAGTLLLGANESIHNILTLNQWLTTIVGVNVPVTVYQLTETVIVTGTLEFVNGSVPYSGATVNLNLTLFGISHEIDVTDGTGDFSISWTIPGSITLGFYDLFVEFNSPYPWIANSFAPLPQIEITAPEYLWPSFNVLPTPVYLGQTLTISGTVNWDNGSLYPNSPVDFYWGDPFGVWELIQLDVLTNGVGDFYYQFVVPASTPLSDRQVWAYIDPAGYATAGMSPTPTITVAIITVDLTAAVDFTLVYLNQDLTFSGNLQFTNTTPMVGYEVEIWWGGNLLTTEITSGTGDFSFVYTVQWDDDIGVISGYALFRPPDVSFGTLDILEFLNDVTVMERVDVFLDPEPFVSTVSRGDTFIVTGYVRNDGDLAADSVTVEALSDGNPTGFTAITNSGGLFSITINVPLSATPGIYNISVRAISIYHDLRNGPLNPWFISIHIAAEVDVRINQVSVMPGETFSVDVQLLDDDSNPLVGEFVSLSLGSTTIANIQITGPTGIMTIVLTVPLSWTEGDGLFTLTANYAGGAFVDPDSFESTNSIHVFTDVSFQSLTPSRIDPGQSFSIEFTLVDLNATPILNRNVSLTLNSTDNYLLSTGADGLISHYMGSYPEGTSFRFTLTVLSSEVTPVQSGEFEINIQTTGGNPLQGTDLLIAGILLVGAVIAILAYLYIVRGMFRSTAGISRGFDVPTKLRNIKKLADAGKYGASITLAYRTFEQMCGSKMGSERSHNETAREYLDRVLQAIPLDLATVEQFVQTYEEARFSHHEMTRERYEEAVRIFTDVYPRIDSTTPVE